MRERERERKRERERGCVLGKANNIVIEHFHRGDHFQLSHHHSYQPKPKFAMLLTII